MKKNKIPLIALSISFLIGIIGGTIAYFKNETTITNNLNLAKFDVTSTETFESPSNWRAGETIPKVVTTTNNGTVPVAIRLSYTEKWIDSDDNDLNISNVVTINRVNEGRWFKDGNYYYYRYTVNPGESVRPFMESVTLNEEVGNVTCTQPDVNGEQVCESLDDTAGNKYILTIKVESADYDYYKSIWNTDVEIGDYVNPIQIVNQQTVGELTIGDLLKVGDTEEFRVVSSDANETVLLAANNLNVGSNTFSGCTQGLQCAAMINESSKGTMAFSSTDYWTGQIGNGLKYGGTASACGPQALSTQPFTCYNDAYVYDEDSNLYTYIEQYKQEMINKGVTVKIARVMNDAEGESVENYSWANNTKYWLGNAELDNNGLENDGVSTTTRSIQVAVMNGTTDRYIYSDSVNYGVRPVIVVSTADILE